MTVTAHDQQIRAPGHSVTWRRAQTRSRIEVALEISSLDRVASLANAMIDACNALVSTNARSVSVVMRKPGGTGSQRAPCVPMKLGPPMGACDKAALQAGP